MKALCLGRGEVEAADSAKHWHLSRKVPAVTFQKAIILFESWKTSCFLFLYTMNFDGFHSFTT